MVLQKMNGKVVVGSSELQSSSFSIDLGPYHL